MRSDKPSLQLAPDAEGMERTATTHTDGQWELHIINYLISHCNAGGLGQTDKETSASELDDSDLGYVEGTLVPVAKYKKQKGRGKQGEKQNTGNVLLHH